MSRIETERGRGSGINVEPHRLPPAWPLDHARASQIDGARHLPPVQSTQTEEAASWRQLSFNLWAYRSTDTPSMPEEPGMATCKLIGNILHSRLSLFGHILSCFSSLSTFLSVLLWPWCSLTKFSFHGLALMPSLPLAPGSNSILLLAPALGMEVDHQSGH